MLSQRSAFISRAEQTAALQFGNQPIHNVIETLWQIGENDIEAV
jgi:hypothetical protein